MFKMSEYSFIAGVLSVALALGCYVLAFVSVRMASRRTALAGATAGGGTVTMDRSRRRPAWASGRTARCIAWLAFAFLTASLVFRTIATATARSPTCTSSRSRSPGASSATYLYFERRYHQRILGLIALPVALAMLLYATTIPSTIEPLVPALQNNLLLSVHVAVAIVAYGTFTVAFAAAVLYLVQPDERPLRPAASRELLDEIRYRAVVVGFPFLTLTIVLGAVWADVAWGTYWSWDPKETASLVTWLIYGAYLHARVVRGWRGERAALAPAPRLRAPTLFTYFGNLFFGGLHSYSGLDQG